MLNPHPGLPELDYIKPASLAEASQFLAQHAGESRPILGGTDVIVRMRDGAWKDRYLVDVKGLDGTTEFSFDPAKGLTVGAAVPMNRVSANADVKKHYPVLAEAINRVAAYQLRNRATIVGNICNASPAGDTIGACLVLGGVMRVFNNGSIREAPLDGFFTGPGKSVLKPGDIAVSVFLPLPPAGSVGRYIKLGRNTLGDLAIVGVTVLGFPDKNASSGFIFRIALASVGPTPLRAARAEAILSENKLSDEFIEKAAEATMDTCTPIDDVRGSARYRKVMIRNLARQAIGDVCKTLTGK